ncbi:Flagellar hook capping protein [Candidatus Magnetoovum chiemensis]|nr:Flagellar hook capping protein [Candidatus Magnetoovum chiemensis]
MDISSIFGTTDTTSANYSTSASQELGKEEFLELFTSQLKYQDPLNPMDSTQFTEQLATFSMLEQLFNINDNFELLQQYQNSLNNLGAVNLIGRTIDTVGNTTASVSGITFEEGITYIALDNGDKVVVTDITKIY